MSHCQLNCFASNVNRFSLYSILKIHRQRRDCPVLRNTGLGNERCQYCNLASRQSIDSTVPMLRVQDYLLKHCPLFSQSLASKPWMRWMHFIISIAPIKNRYWVCSSSSINSINFSVAESIHCKSSKKIARGCSFEQTPAQTFERLN